MGGRFNKQGDLHTRLVLGGHKTSRSLYLSSRILEVYVEALTGFIHVEYTDGLNSTLLSQGCVPGAASSMGEAGRTHIPKTGKGGEEPPIALGQLTGQPAVMPSQ